MKKFYFLALACALGMAGILSARPASDDFISRYDIIDLDFLRQYYTKINNGRPIQFDGYYTSVQWLQPYRYRYRLKLDGLDPDRYNILQMTLEEKDRFHYSFPILLFQAGAGDLHELQQLTPGEEVVIYGRFYNLKESEYAIETDLIETVHKGGHDRDILLDARVSPTPTPTATVTPTPGPNLWQRVVHLVHPPESPTPTGTITPEAGQ